jgi:Putative zinc- or iron-chelating domain
MGAFVDGNDLCAGCANCCRRVEGLLLTDEELDRLPLMRPHEVRKEGAFHVVDMPDGCPYLLPSGWCGTFETRPFDCSLFPAQVGRIRDPGGGARATVVWRWGDAPECPSRARFVRRGVSPAQREALARWSADALGVEAVDVRFGRDLGRGARRLMVGCLRRSGLLPVVRRALQRQRRD